MVGLHLKERGYQAYALQLLGEIGLHREPPKLDQGEASYRQALALAQELGIRPLVAHCRTVYGRLGRPEQMRAELSAAIEMYHAMEMTVWLTRAETTLGQVEG